jgi:hypothetical protein
LLDTLARLAENNAFSSGVGPFPRKMSKGKRKSNNQGFSKFVPFECGNERDYGLLAGALFTRKEVAHGGLPQ